MKKLLLVCALTALAAAAILAPGIGLKARVESAVLTCLKATPLPCWSRRGE